MKFIFCWFLKHQWSNWFWRENAEEELIFWRACKRCKLWQTKKDFWIGE